MVIVTKAKAAATDQSALRVVPLPRIVQAARRATNVDLAVTTPSARLALTVLPAARVQIARLALNAPLVRRASLVASTPRVLHRSRVLIADLAPSAGLVPSAPVDQNVRGVPANRVEERVLAGL
jgi:hypothetical protein